MRMRKREKERGRARERDLCTNKVFLISNQSLSQRFGGMIFVHLFDLKSQKAKNFFSFENENLALYICYYYKEFIKILILGYFYTGNLTAGFVYVYEVGIFLK